jgi:GGDEF domain-containing protein
VLIFGSATCGLTANKAPELRRLYETYRDQADFAFVYMKDAHPSGKSVQVGQEQVRLDQPQTMDHRLQLTQHLLNRTQFTMPVYVDDMLGSGRKGYGSFHLAAYIIDLDRKLAFVRKYKYDTQDIESALKAVLGKDSR